MVPRGENLALVPEIFRDEGEVFLWKGGGNMKEIQNNPVSVGKALDGQDKPVLALPKEEMNTSKVLIYVQQLISHGVVLSKGPVDPGNRNQI